MPPGEGTGSRDGDVLGGKRRGGVCAGGYTDFQRAGWRRGRGAEQASLTPQRVLRGTCWRKAEETERHSPAGPFLPPPPYLERAGEIVGLSRHSIIPPEHWFEPQPHWGVPGPAGLGRMARGGGGRGRAKESAGSPGSPLAPAGSEAAVGFQTLGRESGPPGPILPGETALGSFRALRRSRTP